MRFPEFNSVEDALLVFEHSEEPEARIAAHIYLERALPSPVREGMNRRAREILGKLTPDGFNAKGQPLYRVESMAHATGRSIEELEEGAEILKQLMPDMDCTPVTGTLATTSNPSPGQVMKTDQVDEAGTSVYAMDGRAVMQVMAEEVKAGNSTALECLNKYTALAGQRGCGAMTLTRLKEAARREGGGWVSSSG